MPKRPNPWGDYAPQLKTHVGQKEVNLGVCKEQNMKAVYEHTQKMLFDGARKCTGAVDFTVAVTDVPMDHQHDDHLLTGQMHLDRYLQVHAGANGVTNGTNGVTNGANGVTNGANGVTNGANGVTNGANGHSHGLNGHSHGLNGHSLGLNGHSLGLNGHSLGLNGHGVANGGANGHSHLNGHHKAMPGKGSLSPTSCQVCSRPIRALYRCSFCDKAMCSSCQRQCSNCYGEFCLLCSVANYDSRDETAYCLSCST
ncbi:SIVA1 [Branchiostoma lanceolatum]|uniref:SIVA1 protein n=1 Tax=Branchiostoma lanceolatum TaxID=7740 RepID=A0A8J9ZV22_BRALA|nr:SIVA1 [Branchiostoma lanceolatum]